ncbi:uncharacterized protein LOC128987229 [Macrosteles quadrilineatus]|uniref:uncharacterized protein LOC128987229 n=1 Tax=Macrosteles quadrilineatus TaxID=74068 RepID=UPI0023E1178F|nr:uncharacterized protein LOC128987229 [Macrosteles quadrilineatus]
MKNLLLVSIYFLVLYWECDAGNDGLVLRDWWLEKGTGTQIVFTSEVQNAKEAEYHSDDYGGIEGDIRIVCGQYKGMVKADIYRNHGVWLDSIILHDFKNAACNKIRTYCPEIIVTNTEATITYTMHNKGQLKCKKRTYAINKKKIYALIDRKELEDVECPEKAKINLGPHLNDKADFGVVNILPSGVGVDLEYFENMKNYHFSRRSTQTKTLDSGPLLKIQCKAYCHKDQGTEDTIVIASLVQTSGLVVERFRVTSCSSRSSLQITPSTTTYGYKTIIGLENNKKYEREIKLEDLEGNEYYTAKTLTVGDFKPK